MMSLEHCPPRQTIDSELGNGPVRQDDAVHDRLAAPEPHRRAKREVGRDGIARPACPRLLSFSDAFEAICDNESRSRLLRRHDLGTRSD